MEELQRKCHQDTKLIWFKWPNESETQKDVWLEIVVDCTFIQKKKKKNQPTTDNTRNQEKFLFSLFTWRVFPKNLILISRKVDSKQLLLVCILREKTYSPSCKGPNFDKYMYLE